MEKFPRYHVSPREHGIFEVYSKLQGWLGRQTMTFLFRFADSALTSKAVPRTPPSRVPVFLRNFAARVLHVFFAGFALLTSWSHAADTPAKGTAGWLERGCVALQVLQVDPRSLTREQKDLCTETSYYLMGYFNGAFTMSLTFGEAEAPAIYHPPKEWEEPHKAARALLVFFDKHRALIDPRMKAPTVIGAWHLLSHPKSTQENKAMALSMLQVASEEFGRREDGGDDAPIAVPVRPVRPAQKKDKDLLRR